MQVARARVVLLLGFAGFAACVSDRDPDLRADVNILTQREGELVEQAAARLGKRGVRAIPPIETALHTASPTGRLNCIMALRRIAHAETVPLLKHIAFYDAESAVRVEAEHTLRSFAKTEGDLGDAARKAVRELESQRGDKQPG